MTSDRDPGLQALFDREKQVMIDDDFTIQVMSRIDRLRYRAVVVWAGVGIVLLVALAVIAAPLTDAVVLVTGLLPETLVSIDDQVLAQFLAPVNSIAGAVGLGLLVLRVAIRRLCS